MPQGLERVIAVVNGKGGVGKTTISANIGGMLAASGYRVLLEIGRASCRERVL